MKQFLWLVQIGVWVALLISTDAVSSDADTATGQELLSISVRVVDPEGKPVAGAKVIPWALRSSQGHGLWKSDGKGDQGPAEINTDVEGIATIVYPRFRYLDERVRTTEVTISVDHPDFVHISHEFINVPREAEQPHLVKLERGATLELAPIQDGQPAKLENLHVLWSDPRSWKPGVSVVATETGALQLPAMPAGDAEVLLVRLAGERATHFSPITSTKLVAGQRLSKSIELRAAVPIEGRFDATVPRPVKNGRVRLSSLPRTAADNRVEWDTWAPVREDGIFTIEAWPSTEAIQLVALCDGFIAESGAAPDVVNNVRDPDPYWRPQVFIPQEFSEPIEVAMTPMTRCGIEVVDLQDARLANVEVLSWPNVGWWNGGSQVYCTPLVRGERLLVARDYFAAVDKTERPPFRAVTDERGRCELWLPGKRIGLTAESDDFELPVARGRRHKAVSLAPGGTISVQLRLQPKGTEHLGDWDKLAGVLFGCTGEECRRLLEDPGFRKKMVKVGDLFDQASDPLDPEMLHNAYAEIADGFDELQDQGEAERWRRKSQEQAKRLNVAPAKNAATE